MTTRRHAVILLSLLLVALALPAAEITWYFQDSSTTPTTNRTFYIYPASIQTNGQAIITGDRLSVRLAADGTATNTLVGSEAGTAYQFVLPGPWTNTVGHIIVGTNATYAASTIYTNIEPPLESTSAYTMAQANARFIARNAGSGTNLTLRGTNTIQAISLGGETRTNWPTGGGGGGTTYTNTTDNVGVIAGSGVGTNDAYLARVAALAGVSNSVITVSNQNLLTATGYLLDNNWLATTMGFSPRPGTQSSNLLGTNLAHALVYVPKGGNRTTNYLFTVHRTTPPFVTRIDADNTANQTQIAWPTNGATAGTSLVWASNKLYALSGATPIDFVQIAEIDPVTATATLRVADTNIGNAALGAMTTDGQSLLVGNAGTFSSTRVSKYPIGTWTPTYTNTAAGTLFGAPFSGRALHSAIYDSDKAWFAGFANNSGIVGINPTNLAIVRADFDTNASLLFTNFQATDDIAESLQHIWVPGESGGDGLARVNKTTLEVRPIKSGVAGVCWGAFNALGSIWLTYPQDPRDTNSGVLVRIDPNTMQVDHFSAPLWINELQTDGQRLFATTFYGEADTTGMSKIIVNPLGAHLLTAQANTNGTWDWSIDRRTGLATFNRTNVPQAEIVGLTTLAAGAITNRATSGTVFGTVATVNTNAIWSYGAGLAACNARLIFSNNAYRVSGTSTATFITNDAGMWVFRGSFSVRYSNSVSPVSTNWTVAASAPGPVTMYETISTNYGDLNVADTLTSPTAEFGSVTASATIQAQFFVSTGTYNTTLDGNTATLSPTNFSIIGSNMNSLLLTNSTSSNGLAWGNGRLTVAGPTASASIAGVVVTNGATLNLTNAGFLNVQGTQTNYSGMTVRAGAGTYFTATTAGGTSRIRLSDFSGSSAYLSLDQDTAVIQAGAASDAFFERTAAGNWGIRTGQFRAGSIQLTNQVAPPALGSSGATLSSDGTNIIVVLRNTAGGLTTNKVTLTTYP